MISSAADGWESTACPLCHEQRSRRVLHAPDRLHGVPGEFHLVRCSRCRHVYLNPRPTRDAIGSFYPDDYGSHHVLESLDDGQPETQPDTTAGNPWYLSRWVRAVPGLRSLYYGLRESYAEVIPAAGNASPTALELGCGDGRFLLELRERGWRAVGIEPAVRPAERARRRGFEVHAGVLEDRDLPANGFDAPVQRKLS